MHFRQQFEYEYQFNGHDFIVDLEATKHFDDNKLYSGTLAFDLGVLKKSKNKSMLQLSAFYRRNVSPLSREEDNSG